jgi:inosine-uridine nucleoside N-ribohydrolase
MKNIIFDTDLGGDCDDVMALDLLIAAHKAGECRLLGVTYSARAEAAVECIHAILRQHGLGDIPVGTRKSGESIPGEDQYASGVAGAFPGPVKQDNAPEDSALLEELLTENEAVTVVVTGYLTNMAALLKRSGATALVKEKVKEFAVMGCNFSHQNGINPMPSAVTAEGICSVTEWNIHCDIEGARYFFDHCPVPVTVCPFEVGFGMITGREMTARGGRECADSLSYLLHGSVNGRDSWDPATALYGLYGTDRWFTATAAGRVTIAENGVSDFAEEEGGLHRYLLTRGEQSDVAADIDRLVARI